MIRNRNLLSHEKKVITFFISQINNINEKQIIVEQINKSDIIRDYSNYYLILKFIVLSPYIHLPDDYRFESTVQVLRRSSGGVPSVFNMYVKNGTIIEFEVFNADASAIDYNTVCKGDEILLELN